MRRIETDGRQQVICLICNGNAQEWRISPSKIRGIADNKYLWSCPHCGGTGEVENNFLCHWDKHEAFGHRTCLCSCHALNAKSKWLEGINEGY